MLKEMKRVPAEVNVNIDQEIVVPRKGLNILTTCVFIVGIIAGSGFLALPKAIDNAGWIGLVLTALLCLVSTYTGDLLGKCWGKVREKYPQYKEVHVRDPYPKIGEAAYGKPGRYVVAMSINMTMFGGSVVYVLLAAENISELLPSKNDFSFCYIALIIACALTPVTWLGTPKDFWGIALAAAVATGTASIIVMVVVLTNRDPTQTVTHSKITFISFFTAFGTICFAFGGHPAFPTFQADMKEPKNFGKACLIGYLIVLLLYLPTSTVAYMIYGHKVDVNVLATIPKGPPATVVGILMTCHLIFAIVIVLNPVTQDLERLLKVPTHFTWKRIVTRTTMMASVIFLAESVPHFSSILSLVGGSTVTILAYICPPIFYMKLCKMNSEKVPLHVKVALYEIVFIGAVAGVASTYSAISDLITNKFTVPCYVNPSKA